jgi:hypothetical protein
MDGIEVPTHLLVALAERFDLYAERNEQNLQHQSRDKALQLIGSAKAWRVAADILRHTVLTYTNSFV